MLGTDLTRDLYYLGRPEPGVLAVLTLVIDGTAVAPVFSSRARAEALAARAPRDVAVGCAAADDPRARAEFLEACVLAGAAELALDPPDDPDAPRRGAAQRGPVRPALAYVQSLRSATACI